MEYNHSFFKFMADLIESGTWANLSPAARALYPVLCKFSDESFKTAWPGTDELLRLTGFKSKKSLQEARRDLQKAGLLDVIPGTGRTTTRYHFRFDYKNSKVNLEHYRETVHSRRGRSGHPPGDSANSTLGGTHPPPNQIHINIDQSSKSEKQESLLSEISENLKQFLARSNGSYDVKSEFINELLSRYGQLEVGEAIKIAIRKGKDGDIRYLEGILRNRKQDLIKNNQQRASSGSRKPKSEIFDRFCESLPGELRPWLDMLEFRYKHEEKYYFIPTARIPAGQVQKMFLEKGFNIKIFETDTKEETEKFIDLSDRIESMS